jgi:hypothetical protein
MLQHDLPLELGKRAEQVWHQLARSCRCNLIARYLAIKSSALMLILTKVGSSWRVLCRKRSTSGIPNDAAAGETCRMWPGWPVTAEKPDSELDKPKAGRGKGSSQVAFIGLSGLDTVNQRDAIR